MALKLVFRLAQEFGVSHIQNFGDSLFAIQWMHKEILLRNFTLQNLMYNHNFLLSHIYYFHISTGMETRQHIDYQNLEKGWIVESS
jgi:hypothetical protein